MTGKITLVTPPDYYENANFSILFIGLSEKQQEETTTWLSENVESYSDINIYFYQNEPNVDWLLYALARSDISFINCDSDAVIANIMSSYIISRPNVYYTTEDENLKALLSHISNGFISNVHEFLKGISNVTEQ